MRDIYKFFTIFTKRQKIDLLLVFFLMLLGALMESLGIGAIMPLISLLGQQDFLSRYPDVALLASEIGVTTHAQLVLVGTIALAIIYMSKNLYIIFEVFIQRRLAMKYQVTFSREILSTYLAKPYTYHINHNTSLLLRNVNYGALYIFNNIFIQFCGMMVEVTTVIAILVMLIIIDPSTALAVAGIMSIMVLAIITSFRKRIVRQGAIQNTASADYLKWINQSLGAIKETRILRREKFFLKEFTKEYQKYAKAVQGYGFLAELPRTIIEMLVVVGLLLLIAVKVLFGDNPADIVPVLGVLAMAAFRLMPSANRIVGYYNAIKNQMPFFNDIYDVLLEIKERLSSGKRDIFTYDDIRLTYEHKLQVVNLSFKYSDDSKDILRNVSFEIPKGKFIGIIGSSGAGKTTFVDILLGLLPPTHGQILCDGHNVSDNIRAWQANLAYVPQDIYLLDGSIKENIALGISLEEINDELINTVLDMAELTDFVNSLPTGLETFVGERGVKLSGGQRQRIGIARALYQKPEILILDEATSALDNETEKNITDTILKFKGKITIIAIAHRVSTLEACDFKIKLENGRAQIIE